MNSKFVHYNLKSFSKISNGVEIANDIETVPFEDQIMMNKDVSTLFFFTLYFIYCCIQHWQHAAQHKATFCCIPP